MTILYSELSWNEFKCDKIFQVVIIYSKGFFNSSDVFWFMDQNSETLIIKTIHFAISFLIILLGVVRNSGELITF